MSYQVKESEKKTLWNIQECNRIVAQKANREYIDSSCALLEEKFKKEIRQQQQDSLSSLINGISDLKLKTTKLEQDIEYINARSQKSIEQLKKEFIK